MQQAPVACLLNPRHTAAAVLPVEPPHIVEHDLIPVQGPRCPFSIRQIVPLAGKLGHIVDHSPGTVEIELYIRTARAKGLRDRLVVRRHGLHNALIPVITIMGVQAGILLGGTVIIEQIFTMPGVGRLTFEAIQRRDYPQLQANVLFIGTVFVLINLIVDLTYAWLDPRINYR